MHLIYSNFLVFIGNLFAIAVVLPNHSKLTHFLYFFLPLFILSLVTLFPIFNFFLMITAMLDNLSARMVESKARNCESFIRQQINVFAQLQKALNFPMLILMLVG